MATGISGRAFLVTGANKGQGYALCERILQEHNDTHVFLCSRDRRRGEEAVKSLSSAFHNRVDLVQLDVANEASIQAAVEKVRELLGDQKLCGLVSNAGILWGHSLSELFQVCTVGVRSVLDAFLPLMDEKDGRMIVVSSGLGPLMLGFSQHANMLLSTDCDWAQIQVLMEKCLAMEGKGPDSFEEIGFSGGPFAENTPDFHYYGLAKMFADVYMLSLARKHPNLRINSCDPGLVYTDLLGPIPAFSGKTHDEIPNAKSPREGVEVHMRLLFGGKKDGVQEGGGFFYAMDKEGKLTSGGIDKRPDVQEEDHSR